MEFDDLRSEADHRLQGLFEDDPDIVQPTIVDLIRRTKLEPDLTDVLLETLDESLDEGNDATSATAWIALILGEIQEERAVGALGRAATSEDELVATCAIRGLQRVGEPGVTMMLERLRDDEISSDHFANAVEILEGVRTFDSPQTRESVEEHLLSYLYRPGEGVDHIRRQEAAAITLARLGVRRAKEPIERLHTDVYGRRNSFLQEAIDLLAENPEGVPCRSETSWSEEFRWSSGREPGGEIFIDDEGEIDFGDDDEE